MGRCRRGFTLIEIMIVVTIIGILAALIIPRLLGSIETANLAEAYTTIGALSRAEQRYMDYTFLDPLTISCANPPAPCADADLARLGMANITQNKFKYSCVVSVGVYGYCQAYRWMNDAQSTARIYKYFFYTTTPANVDRWYCGTSTAPNYVRRDTGTVGLAPNGVVCRANF